mgnify:CR=1 FL=1
MNQGHWAKGKSSHVSQSNEQTRDHGGKHEQGHMDVFPESGDKGENKTLENGVGCTGKNNTRDCDFSGQV